MQEANKDSPPKIIEDYLAALRKTKGDSYANETRLEYLNGWFVVDHVNGKTKRYRKKEIILLAERLRDEPFDGDAYEEAKRQKREAEAEQFRLLTQRQQRWPATRQSQPISGAKKLAILGGILIAGVGFLLAYSNSAEQRATERAEKEAALKREESEKKAAIQRERDMRDFLKRPLPAVGAQSALDSEYISALGRIRIGDALYWSDTHRLFGYIVDTESGFVWVADSYAVGSTKLRVYAKRYDRSYITENFLVKK